MFIDFLPHYVGVVDVGIFSELSFLPNPIPIPIQSKCYRPNPEKNPVFFLQTSLPNSSEENHWEPLRIDKSVIDSRNRVIILLRYIIQFPVLHTKSILFDE